jgi:hypothetical protein
VAGLGVQPGRLVQHQYLGLVDETSRDGQTPLEAGGQSPDGLVLLVQELEQLQALVDALLGQGAGHVEVAGIDRQVLAHREVGVQIVLLGHYPQERLDPSRLVAYVQAVYGQFARCHRRYARDHAGCCGLPGPVWAKQTEALPGANVEADSVYGSEVTVALDQIAGTDNDVHGTTPRVLSHYRGANVWSIRLRPTP